MKARKMARKVMTFLIVGLLGCLLSVPIGVQASPPTEIQFAKGAVRSAWSGVVRDGNKKFRLRLTKGQSLKVGGEDVYTWSVITPKGTALGCDGGESCAPDVEIPSLPYSGVYIISTDYRMSSCANCPVAATRQVTVIFEAR
jgi:hypothetical protein